MNHQRKPTSEHIFCPVLDNVIEGLTARFCAAEQISYTFNFLWSYQVMSKEEMKFKTAKIAEKYSEDVSNEDPVLKINNIKILHKANLCRRKLRALELLHALAEYRLESIFPNLSVSLRIFLTAPAIAASAERSFSELTFTKYYLKSTMGQDRLNNVLGSALSLTLQDK